MSKQYINILPERKAEFIDAALANDLVGQKLNKFQIYPNELRTNPRHFHGRKPTNANRKKLFGSAGEWKGMEPAKGVAATWTGFNDILLIMVFYATVAFEKLRAKDGNQKEAIHQGGAKYRELFKHFTGYETGRTKSSLQNAGLPYVVIAKQARQVVNIAKQTGQLQEAESKLSDIEDQLADIEARKRKLQQQNGGKTISLRRKRRCLRPQNRIS